MWSGHIQTELRDRSNKRVADSALRAAEANERAAEAQLALEKLRMPRSLTVEQQRLDHRGYETIRWPKV